MNATQLNSMVKMNLAKAILEAEALAELAAELAAGLKKDGMGAIATHGDRGVATKALRLNDAIVKLEALRSVMA